jgi:hypothetical protein
MIGLGTLFKLGQLRLVQRINYEIRRAPKVRADRGAIVSGKGNL